MTENRNEANYYLQTAEVPNPTGGTMQIVETLALFSLNQDRFNPLFKGWNSLEAFKTYADTNSNNKNKSIH